MRGDRRSGRGSGRGDGVDPWIEKNISYNGTYSHGVAFETRLSEPNHDRAATGGPDKQAVGKLRSARSLEKGFLRQPVAVHDLSSLTEEGVDGRPSPAMTGVGLAVPTASPP